MKILNLIGDKLSTDGLREQFALDVLIGLSSKPKSISPKYFYNARGSELFQEITENEDYYLTGLEFEILKNESNNMANNIKSQTSALDIIELGAGDGRKTSILVDALKDAGIDLHYYPIDISEEAMNQMQDFLKEDDHFKITGVVAEYFSGLNYLREYSNRPKLLMFLGSNIGNFNRAQAAGFMRRAWHTLNSGDWLLLGADLKKDIDVLHRAYNDGEGITRKFNLNLLDRINHDLEANFDLNAFDHYGSYNPLVGAMESFLISKKPQKVYIKELEKEFSFKAFEPIHMEYSTKYLDEELKDLSNQSGFMVEETYYDKKRWYSNLLLKVTKN